MAENQIFGLQNVGIINDTPLMIEDVHQMIEEIMEIHPRDIKTVQQYGPDPKRTDIKMISDSKFNEYQIDRYVGQEYSLRTGRVARVCKPFEELKEIRVRRIPSTWDDENVYRILSF